MRKNRFNIDKAAEISINSPTTIYNRIQPMLDHYSQNYTDLLAGTKLRWWGSQSGNVSGLLSWYKSEYQTKELPKLKTFFNQRPAYAIPPRYLITFRHHERRHGL